MERVIFYDDDTGERIPCLLNPETLVFRRRTGVQTRRASGGKLTAISGRHDPLLATGGGQTDLTLELLFDLDVGGASVDARDVRELTGRLWEYAEENRRESFGALPPVLRFIWGCCWNLPVVITAISERFERFSKSGVPHRSWMSLQLREIDGDEGFDKAVATESDVWVA